MKYVRYNTAVIVGVVVSVLGFFAAPSAAFAMVLRPLDNSGPVTSPVVTLSGMAGWEIALIAVGAALFAAAVTAVALQLRFRATLTQTTA
jgi:hypothetical protein